MKSAKVTMSSKQPQQILLLLVVFIVVGIGGYALLKGSHAATTCTPDALLVNPCRPWQGTSPNSYPVATGGLKTRITEYETRTGSQVDFAHDFSKAPATLTPDELYYINRPNTYLLLNYKPSTDWASADGSNQTVNNNIIAMAKSIKAVAPKKILFALWHEPNNDVSGGAAGCPSTFAYVGTTGTPAQYRAMWANVRQQFTNQGVTNVDWGIIYMSGPQWACMQKELWPGNNLVDWVMWDHYYSDNETFKSGTDYFYNWLTTNSDATHDFTNHPWGIGEWGSWAKTQSKTYQQYVDGGNALKANTYPRIKLWTVWDSIGSHDSRTQYDFNGLKDQTEQDSFNTNWAQNSAFVNPVQPPTNDTQPPTAPTGLSAVAPTPLLVNLSWAASTDNVGVTGYQIYRSGTLIGTVGTSTTYADSTVASSTSYTYTVKALDAASNISSASNTASVTTPTPVDTTAPTAPGSLTATATRSQQVNLSWTASTDNVGVTGYRIYRQGILLTSVNAVSSYADTSVIASTAYSYSVKAFDAAGNTSAASNTASVTTPAPPDTTAPSVPAGLSSPSQTASSVTVAWNASTDNVAVTGYHFYRNGVLIQNTATTSITDTGLSATTAYAYTVAAYDAAGNTSAVSAALTATTLKPADTTAPTTPSAVSAIANTATQVDISWQPSTDNVGVAGYYVQRNGVTLATVTTTGYTDNTVLPNTAYSYVIVAFDAASNVSAASVAATVTTPQQSDTTAPTTPSNVSAVAVSSNQVDLAWSASTDNVAVAGYKVSRNGAEISKSATTSFGDATAQPGVTYTYAVKAYDASNNTSNAAKAAVTTPPASNGLVAGLKGTYFNNQTLSGAGLVRNDSSVNFNWGSSAPLAGISADHFSARWTGRITAPTTGTYTLYTQSDDGVRLWVDDQLLIDNWQDHSSKQDSQTITMNAGVKYNIRMEYYENTGNAVAQLSWSGPSIVQAVIPSTVLVNNSYGISANYYNSIDLSGPVALTRIDDTLNFDWGTSAPDTRLNSDKFSVHWSGKVKAQATDTYTFYTNTDDGVRLWVNGQQLVNDWTNHKATLNSGTIALVGGVTYDVQMDYYEDSGSAIAQLLWSHGTAPKEIIPNTSLRDQ